MTDTDTGMTNPNPYPDLIPDPIKTKSTKAWVGAGISVVLSFATGVQSALLDGTISGYEWSSIAVASLVTAAAVFGGVYVTPNRPK